jgi:hypothetical protein
MVKSIPSRLLEVYSMFKCQKNANRTKYSVKPLILRAQFYAVISLKRKCVKKGIL